jgi:hypothetical protein
VSKVRLLCITIYAFAAALGLHEFLQYIDWAKPLNLAAVKSPGHVTAAERALRPNYPYSVIPGGAYDRDELRKSIEKDKIVRAHYADFDLNSTTAVTLAEDRFQYVSYRINNRVFWTHKKIRIPKGEVLLTDGKHFARTRCGNRLCATLAYNTSFTIAPLKKLVLPPFTMQLLARNQIDLAPPEVEMGESPELAFDLPRLVPYAPPAAPLPPRTTEVWPPITPSPGPVSNSPIFAGLPITPPITQIVQPGPPQPISAAPEPASIYLFMVAFAISFWFITRWLPSEPVEVDRAE